jgi:hypothetical protein
VASDFTFFLSTGREVSTPICVSQPRTIFQRHPRQRGLCPNGSWLRDRRRISHPQLTRPQSASQCAAQKQENFEETAS